LAFDALDAEQATATRPVPDPIQFAADAGLDPDAWQADVLTSTAPRLLLNCSRQSGKSTTVATLAAYTALYQAPSLILLLSPGLRQSVELFRKVLDAYHAAGQAAPSEAESVLRLELTNGSRILALPGKEGTLRGYSGVSLLVLDEASRIDDALYYATRPMLAVSGGRLVMLSTPFGKRGVFHQAWTEGVEWTRIGPIPASACKRIPADFLAAEKADLPGWVYRQEYECSFEEDAQAVFSYADVHAALTDDLEPLALWA
jgi:hypothetical protein